MFAGTDEPDQRPRLEDIAQTGSQTAGKHLFDLCALNRNVHALKRDHEKKPQPGSPKYWEIKSLNNFLGWIAKITSLAVSDAWRILIKTCMPSNLRDQVIFLKLIYIQRIFSIHSYMLMISVDLFGYSSGSSD